MSEAMREIQQGWLRKRDERERWIENVPKVVPWHHFQV
jgi:hypothetical protein